MILDHIRPRFLGDDLYARATYTRVYTVIIDNNQLFNIRQQEYYCVTEKLNRPFSLTQMWIRMSHPGHSVAVTLSRISGDRT